MQADFPDRIVAAFLDVLRTQPAIHGLLESLLDLFSREATTARLFACGGLVRDIAVATAEGGPTRFKDLDLVLEGLPAALLEELLPRLRAQCPELEWTDRVGASFPVWKLKVQGVAQPVDLAMMRTECSFGVGHRDFEVRTEAVSVEEDARRRDFAMNALYIELRLDGRNALSGRFQDFHHGLDAILTKQIRCVGDPVERLAEDPLRMLRAVRFEACLPGFRIHAGTGDAIRALAPELLPTVSPDRYADELFRALAGNPASTLGRLSEYGILEELFPELAALGGENLPRVIRRMRSLLDRLGARPGPALLFSALLLDLGFHETSRRMRKHLASARVNHRFFSSTTITRVARRVRLPNVRKIRRLCDGVLLLSHYAMLENRDAVVEEALADPEEGPEILALHAAARDALGLAPLDLADERRSRAPSGIDFGELIRTVGIPSGPHLHEIRLSLRQAEIEGRIRNEGEARARLDWLYASDTHLIREHIDKLLRRTETPDPEGTADAALPGSLAAEVRWLLFTRPVRLIRAYREREALARVFPELARADRTVGASAYHFSDSFLNDVLLGLSLLCEEVDDPSPVQILSLLFLDIGKSRTRREQGDGRTTFYGHERVGARLAYGICKRLGIGEQIAADVHFIIENHLPLMLDGGPNRVRNMVGNVDRALIEDLLLVHRVDQTAKMRIHAGQRIDEGQLDNHRRILNHLDAWIAEADTRAFRRAAGREALLSGRDVMGDSPAWGPGLPEGPEVGALKLRLYELQSKGILSTREQAMGAARGQIVLRHLVRDPLGYLDRLRETGLLPSVLPEVAALVDLDQTGPYHTEDVYTHTRRMLRSLPAERSREIVLAAVFHDSGKAVTRTYDEKAGGHHFYGHARESARLFRNVCERFDWTNDDFDLEKTAWLIRGHMKLHVDWRRQKRPKRLIRKMLFCDGCWDVPEGHRSDLLALAKADTLASRPPEASTREEKVASHACLERLVREVAEEIPAENRERMLAAKIRKAWNGESVLRHFSATGPEIGRLLSLGQAYAARRLEEGAGAVREEEVLEYVKSLAGTHEGDLR